MKQIWIFLTLFASSAAWMSAAVPTSVAISPQGAVWKIGSSQQFTVTCTYQDGNTDNCSKAGGAAWTTSRSASYLSVTNSGLATWVAGLPSSNGYNEGFVIVTAGGISDKAGTFGQAASDTYYLYPTPDYRSYKTSLSINPQQAPLNVTVGSTVALGVGMVMNNNASSGQSTGAPFNDPCNWTSSNPAVATVNRIGDVTGVSPGNVTVTCNLPGNAVFGNSTITGWQAPGNFLNLTVVAGGTGNKTWYVRPNGGTPFTNSTATPNGQCDGLGDADYPGKGVNQHCAFGTIRHLWSDENTYGQHKWMISGGDTVIVRQNPNGYNTGLDGPGGNPSWLPTNCHGDSFGCNMPTIPSGTAAHHTRILGENYANCHADSAKTLLHVSWNAATAFDLSDSQFVDVACFEITDQAACAANGNYTNYCSNANSGYEGVATSALSASDNLSDLFIHGISSDAWHGAVGTGVVADHIHIKAAPDAGINMDDDPWGSGNISTAGGLTLTNSITEFTGCVEEYPVVHNYPYIECRDQNTGAYGDGFGTATTTGDWYFDHDLWRYNFQDGLDLLHSGMHSLTVTNSASYGNDGQQFKVGSGLTVRFQNNTTLHNCQRIGQLFGDEPASAIVPGVALCRAAGDGILINFDGLGSDVFQHNTYVGYGTTSYDINCTGGWDTCTNTASVYQDNVNLGLVRTGYDDNRAPGLFYEELPSSAMPANSGWAIRTNNAYYGFRGCPTLLSGEVCVDPLFVNEPANTISAETQLDNFNFNLSSSSASKAAGITLSGLTTDSLGNAYASPPSMGAIQFGAATAPAPSPTKSTAQVTGSASPAQVTVGQPVVITAGVSGTAGSTPTGSVTFLSNGAALATVALNATGSASYTAPALPAGSYTMAVSYGGDSLYASATSSGDMVTVQPAPPVSVVSISIGHPEYGFNVLPYSQRRLFATVANGSTNKVTWAVKSGSATLASSSGSWVDVTAPYSGSTCSITGGAAPYGVSSASQFTVEATSVDDPTAKADVTFNVCNPKVEVSVVPFYRALYANQPEDVQALVLGAVNQRVHWTIASQPNGGDGHLGDTTSRDVVFVATVPGRYKLVATSLADPTKSAYATLYVTGNALPNGKLVTPNSTQPVDCSVDPAMLGTVYDVGPSQTFRRLQDVPFPTLTAGSTIRVHNEDTTGTSPTVYREYVQISQAGTADQPIRLCGVPDSHGNLPILDAWRSSGRSDVTDAAAGLGVVTLAGTSGFQNYPNYSGPAYVTVEGLQIRNASSGKGYIAPNGSPASWSDASACIRVAQGQNTAFIGNDLNACGNGAYSGFDQTNGWGGADSNVLWEGNNIHNNGSATTATSHQMALQAWGEVVQLNRIENPVSNAKGANIQSRGIQGVVRYNYFGDGAATQLDLVDVQGAPAYMSFAGFLDGGTSSHHAMHPQDAYPVDRIAAEQEAWNSHYVYGNIYLNSRSAAPIRFGMDRDSGEADRKGNLFWYNNTFYQKACTGCSNQAWTLFDTTGGNGSSFPQVEFQTVQSYNNIIWMDNPTQPDFQWNDTPSFIGVSGKNLLPQNWGTDSMVGGLGTGWDDAPDANAYQNATDLSAHLTGFDGGDLPTAMSIPFDPTSWVLNSNIAASTKVPSSVCEMPVRFSYLPDVGYAVPRTGDLNMGATDTAKEAAAEMTTLVGSSQYNTRYANCR